MKKLYFLSVLLFLSFAGVAQMVVTPSSGCQGNAFAITISGLPAGATSSCVASSTAGVVSAGSVVIAATSVSNLQYNQTSVTAGISIPANFAPGVYDFSLTGPNLNGTCNSSTVSCTACFTVYSIPEVTSVVGPTVVCKKDTVSYSALATGTADGYTWKFPTGWNDTISSATSSTPVIAGNNGGKIYVTAFSNSCGTGNTDSLTVVTDDVPATPVISAVGTNLTSSITLATQQWYKDANLLPGAVGPSYTATQSGSYTVVATNNCGSSAASAPSVVTISGINNVVFAGLKIYPNPVQNNLIIENNNGTELQASLYGLDGSLIKTTDVRERAAFDMTALAAGIYTLKISNGTDTRIEKITKQ